MQKHLAMTSCSISVVIDLSLSTVSNLDIVYIVDSIKCVTDLFRNNTSHVRSAIDGAVFRLYCGIRYQHDSLIEAAMMSSV